MPCSAMQHMTTALQPVQYYRSWPCLRQHKRLSRPSQHSSQHISAVRPPAAAPSECRMVLASLRGYDINSITAPGSG